MKCLPAARGPIPGRLVFGRPAAVGSGVAGSGVAGTAVASTVARAALASIVLVTALAGCASLTQHATTSAASASASASAAARTAAPSQSTCLELVSWNQRGASAVKALYADTGALTANARANNAKAVAAAGRKLTSDAIAAATLPVPPVAGDSWKTLTAAYAAAGTALANGDATGAVPKLQEGNSAISAFSTVTARCS
jgi:hypothetical protein